jgi:hypothetical protein
MDQSELPAAVSSKGALGQRTPVDLARYALLEVDAVLALDALSSETRDVLVDARGQCARVLEEYKRAAALQMRERRN